ncbi:GlxA family transcriptional regulator [Ideonella oryzae]|uniref:DJ-1/PfpI family protein n=1 Tax=Ideonella oryzae TaxID=2937441 RepID=A0ABT1BLY9_9BURK|nr:DJ-1/PfpI family protein [Ideonella oryzae]MCO5977241.1 DJ-1/PfpI family protein [Ideonella oryzae]
MRQDRRPTDILLLMFDEVELLDFAGPYEVFTTANRVAQREAPDVQSFRPPFQLRTASPDGRPVRARAGLGLQPDLALPDAPPPDLLIVPGGVVDGLQRDRDFLATLRSLGQGAGWVASICTGAFLLADAGLLRDAEATTHWEDLEALGRQHPHLRLRPDRRWVDTGRVLSSAGIAAGLDLSLHLVRRCAGVELAQRTARQLDYPWDPTE